MKGSVTARLLALGWRRDDGPADEIPECGAAPGFCIRPARWTASYYDRPWCAQHALMVAENRERYR